MKRQGDIAVFVGKHVIYVHEFLKAILVGIDDPLRDVHEADVVAGVKARRIFDGGVNRCVNISKLRQIGVVELDGGSCQQSVGELNSLLVFRIWLFR